MCEPYVVQRAAAAVFTESGMAEIQANLDYYRQNAKVIADALDECGEGYFRLTAFGDAEKTKVAAQRIKAAIQTL